MKKDGVTIYDCSFAVLMKSHANISSLRQRKILRSHVMLKTRFADLLQ